jgi:DNA-binding NtrC family response regulator
MRLLIVGSLDGQLGAATQLAIQRGAQVSQAADPEVALKTLRSGQGAELVMIDVQFEIDPFISSLRSEHINVPVVACGVGTDTEAAVKAIRAGAKEYIPLPPDPELIAAVLEAVTEESHKLVYRDAALGDLIRLADQIAPSEASILISGESGTGKEILARRLHAKSRRAQKRFVTINCAAIPENLLESELFGHEKGAFTGAIARRIGKFEEAHGGTLLLDEISEMDPRLQAKLLRAIQEREIDRVGGSRPIRVDIRLIATSNRDLGTEVAKGRFREDLLFRLNVFHLHIPPLRERPDDIPALAEFFGKKYAEVNEVAPKTISEQALKLLTSHAWRGNVRELENTMHRAVLLASGNEIGTESILLADSSRPGEAPTRPDRENGGAAGSADGATGTAKLVGRTVADVERDLILDTLGHCLGNRTHAAHILGISIRTLRNKLRQYSDQGVQVPMPGELSRAAL